MCVNKFIGILGKIDRKWKYDYEFCGNKNFKGMANIYFGMCVGVGMLSDKKILLQP